MIEDHDHNGISARKLKGRNLVNAPQSSLTTANASAFTSGGIAVLQNGDAAILDNMRTRINELESKLQALGLLE